MSIDPPEPHYELSQEDDGLWIAVHVATGIASHGSTPNEAVEMTDEAVELHQRENTPGDEEYQRKMLARFEINVGDSIDPDRNIYRYIPDPDRDGGYNKQEELEHAELPPNREPRYPEDLS